MQIQVWLFSFWKKSICATLFTWLFASKYILLYCILSLAIFTNLKIVFFAFASAWNWNSYQFCSLSYLHNDTEQTLKDLFFFKKSGLIWLLHCILSSGELFYSEIMKSISLQGWIKLKIHIFRVTHHTTKVAVQKNT